MRASGLPGEGCRVSDISAAVQAYVEANGFSVVCSFVGHGVQPVSSMNLLRCRIMAEQGMVRACKKA